MNYKYPTLLIMLLIAGCRADEGKTAAPTSVAAAIKQLEASGQYPVLQRDSTILGIDADSNGVRDDIDTYINSLPDTAAQKEALRQDARALSKAITTDPNNKSGVADAGNAINASIACLFEEYPEKLASQRSREIEKYTINTKERFVAYSAFNSAVSGSAFYSPKRGAACIK